jgi:uncharacterized protein YkwD
MRNLIVLLFLMLGNISIAQNSASSNTTSPLAAYSSEWNQPQYRLCNTAAKANYMSEKEKTVIYVLNLARTYPALFAKTVIAQYPSLSGNNELAKDQFYYQSLLTTLQQMAPLPMMTDNEKCYQSALCHALLSGKTGYVGHNRNSEECDKKKYFYGECCDYGSNDPVEIIIHLLIDKDIVSLGHRKILLGKYTSVGISIQPHTDYRFNTVLDFYY